MSLLWPWWLLVLPLPLALSVLLSPVRGRSLQVPFLAVLDVPQAGSAPLRRMQLFAAWLIWVLLVLAAARPVVPGEKMERMASGRDLLLAVDLSASMGHRDMDPGERSATRLDVLAETAGTFIDRRGGDRIGLLLFGERAYLEVQPTFDHAALKRVLDGAELGLAGRDTALGDAIGLSVRHLSRSPASSRVLLLLTDGANTAGDLDPEEAAGMAAEGGLRIYTVGLGQPGRAGPDVRLLESVAKQTGGRYLEARDRAAMEQVYRQLDAMEPARVTAQWLRIPKPVHAWPLGMALLLSVLWAAARMLPRMRSAP